MYRICRIVAHVLYAIFLAEFKRKNTGGEKKVERMKAHCAVLIIRKQKWLERSKLQSAKWYH